MALEFDGSSQYIQVTQNSGLPIYNETTYSVCGWVKAPAQDDKRIFAEGSSASNNPLLTIGSGRTTDSTTNKLQVYIRNDAGTALLGAYGTKSTTTVFDDTWHHFCWVDNNGDADLYIDGVLDATNFNYTRSGTVTLNRTGIAAVIRAALGNWLDGELFDIRCYNRCLSESEIAEICHRRGADKVWQGLVGWWRLDEKTSGILTPNPYDTVVPTMTSNTTPSGVASASSEYDSSWQAWKAFSFSTGSWASTVADMPDVWLKYDFGSGVTKTVKCYIIQSRQSAPTCNPKDWTFEGSNNDSDWTILDTQTNITAWDTAGFFSFPILNSTAYRYYRLNISANNGYAVTHVMNLQLLEYSPANAVIDLSGNGNHGTPYNSPVYQASPHRLRRGVLVS